MYLQDAINIIKSAFWLPFEYLMDPKKRIFLPYLIIAFIIALFIYYKKTKSVKKSINQIFNPKIWFNQSSKTDIFLIFFNAFIKIIVLSPLLILGLYISYYVNEFLLQKFGYQKPIFNKTETIFYYSITLLVVGDFFYYLFHLLMHKVPFLWKFHAVHHSATTLTPLTQYRIHPVELIITNLRVIVVSGVITGIFDYYSQSIISEYLFIGVNIFSLIFHVFGSNLRHSHVPFKYFNWLESIFISPYQHQIHHSNHKKHYDKNLGSKFAIWDKMFGTLIKSKQVKSLSFGIGEDTKDYKTFFQNIITPFKKQK